jgi:TRAP-type mannitol/chloroaromatic compound transport system permease small subunit
MKFLRRLAGYIDTVNEKIGTLVSWLTSAMVLAVCYDVFTRYALRSSSAAVQELEWHLFAVIFLLGSAHTLKDDKHVRIDIFYAKLPDRGKAVVNLLGTLLFLMPFALLLIWTSRDFVMNSFAIREASPNPGGLPARYILKACIPVSFFLLFLQGISQACKSLIGIKDGGKKGRREPLDV